MVALVTANTMLLASNRLAPAALGACLVSWLWWSNSSRHRDDVPGAGLIYGAGAALGTLTGGALVRWWGV